MRSAILVLLMLVAGWLPAADPSLERAAPAALTATAAVPVPAATPIVGYVPITGEIDEAKAAYYGRALKEARERHVTHLVVHLTTPGGELGAGMKMLNDALGTPKDAPRLIAFVDDHSLSAGSLIAYGHDEILVTPKALLGDIGVITIGSDGEIKYLPEKIETVVRSLLRNAAQNRGWNQAKLVKMTARTQELYRFTVPDKTTGDKADGDKPAGSHDEFVIEDDLPTWLAAHPEVKTESKVVVLGNDRLLSYTAREAVDAGMATALVADLDAVYARLGVTKAAVIDLSPNQTERVAWKLSGWAPLLASVALLLLFMEFKMPSGGIWIALSALAGVAFFVCQFYMDLASYVEVAMILGGIALIIAEMFLPTAGLLGVGGGLLIVSGLVLAFMPDSAQFAPSTDGWGAMLGHAVMQSLMAVAVVSVGTSALLAALPHVALRTGLADAAAINATSAGAVESAAVELAGRRGSARTLLRPGGQVDIDGRLFNAVTADGAYIQAGAGVVVVSARFGELVVKAVEDAAPGATDGTGAA